MKNMGLLTRDQILQAQDIKHEDVDVPEWGGTVRVVALAGAERDAFEESITVIEGKGKKRTQSVSIRNIRAKLVARAVVDEAGARLFSDQDVHALGKKSSIALDRVFSVAQRLSGLSDDDMEALAGNSADGQNDSSTSD